MKKVLKKYKKVITQINLYSTEYFYLRNIESSFYYQWCEKDIIYFILNRCSFKYKENGELVQIRNLYKRPVVIQPL